MRACFYKGTRTSFWHGLYNRFVRWWTIGKYSHVEIQFTNGISASSSFTEGGVRFKQIYYEEGKWDFVELPDEMEKYAMIWFLEHKGKAYDYWAAIRYAIGFMPDSKDKYHCSESVMSALGYEDAWRFEPNAAAAVLRR